MRTIASVLLFVLTLLSSPAHARDVAVHGYYRSNGTYVQPYHRSAPDGTVTNNYSYSGNTNPYTGSTGHDHYIHDATSPYYTGPDSHGNVGHDTTADPTDLDPSE